MHHIKKNKLLSQVAAHRSHIDVFSWYRCLMKLARWRYLEEEGEEEKQFEF